MATAPVAVKLRDNGYPTGDGRPMSETDFHYVAIKHARERLGAFYAADPKVYVSGNLLLFYERGNRRRHVSPDVFVVKGVPKHERPNYLLWEEGKGPDIVIEFTSSSTRSEDEEEKFQLYQFLQVPEYFLFDPLAQYLRPPLKGFRLRGGSYTPLRAVRGRLPSRVLGLHLEREGMELRFYDPVRKQYLPTTAERLGKSEAERQRAEAERRRAEAERRRAEAERQRAEAENERLRRELEALRRRLPKGS